jgi:hypothetical protein
LTPRKPPTQLQTIRRRILPEGETSGAAALAGGAGLGAGFAGVATTSGKELVGETASPALAMTETSPDGFRNSKF